MPQASKQTASQTLDLGVMEGHYEDFGKYLVGFEKFNEDVDTTPMFKGLPDDRCQAEHWGYVVKGSITFRFADRSETYETGDAFYAPAGHLPLIKAGTELIEFSESKAYHETMKIAERNIAAMTKA